MSRGAGVATGAALPWWLAAVVGFGLSMLVWLALLERHEEAEQGATNAELERLMAVAAVNLNERLKAIERVARRWARRETDVAGTLRLEAEVLRQSYPSMRAVGWVGTDRRVRWVEPLEGNEAALGLDVNADPRRADAYSRAEIAPSVLSLPIAFVQGGSGVLAIAAARPEGPITGFVYAALDLKVLFDRELRVAAPQNALRVESGGNTIYELGDLGPGTVARGDFEVGGVPWRLTVSVPRESRLLPHLVLLLGLGLSSSLGLALHRQAAAASAADAARASAQALKQSEARFRTLFETIPVGAALMRSDDHRIAACNGRFAHMLEVTREEALALRANEWDIQRSQQELEALNHAALDHGTVNEFETRWRSRSGRVIDVQVTSEAVSIDGASYIYCACTDISDRKSAEQAAAEAARFLQAVVDGALDPIFVKDGEGRYVLVNTRTAEVFGRPREAVIGRRDEDLLPVDLAERLSGNDREILEGRGPNLMEETLLIDDARRTYLTAKTPLIDPAGRIAGLIGVARDITDRKEAEDEVRRLNAALEQRVAERTRQLAETNEELRAFSYTVAHDLRAPLRGMRGLSQALLEDYGKELDATAQEYAQRIADAAARLDHLIQDLLAYAQLARQEIALRPVALGRVMDAALRQLQSEVAERDAEIDLSPLSHTVLGEESMLVQIVANLIGNAIRFVAPDNRPHVRIRSEGADGRVRVWVEDNGIGIAPEHQDRIFRVFERLHGMTDYPGTGIGLAIVRRGVERMGGRVGLRSFLGQGSSFWIELPGADHAG